MTDPSATLTSIYAVTDFDLQYWDGSTWVTLPNGQVRGNRNVWRRFTFPSLTTTALRMWILNGSYANPAGVAVQEIEAYTTAAVESVWFDGSLPAGATPGGDEPWTWVTANPPPYASGASHQSRIAAGFRQHTFTGATQTMAVNRADRLFAYVFIDPVNVPSQIM